MNYKTMYKLAILFFIVTHSVFSQDIFKAGEIKQKKYVEEIDFEIIENKIIVPVVIAGKTYRFLLDTGAPNVVSERLHKKLNTEVLLETLIKDANNNIDTMKVVSIPELNIGKLTFENNISLISDLDNHPVLSCFGIDGFLGSNLFKNTAIKISLTEKKLYITDNARNFKPLTRGVKLLLAGSQAAPYINITLERDNNKATEDVLIDTGMDGLYEMSNRAFDVVRTKDIFSQVTPSSGTGAISLFGKAELETQHQFTIPKYSIDKAVFQELSSNTTNDENSRIGLELLNYGDIIIDFKKKKFYFENMSVIPLKAPKKCSYTLSSDLRLIVDFVWDEQLKKQMRHGDKVIRIDDLNVKDMSVCELLSAREYTKHKNSYEVEFINHKDEITTVIIQP